MINSFVKMIASFVKMHCEHARTITISLSMPFLERERPATQLLDSFASSPSGRRKPGC
jgi:hypothetical protein